MITISKNSHSNYLVKIVEITDFIKHENADKLKKAIIDGNIVITNIETDSGIFLYFPLESSLNKEFLSFMNSFEDTELNSNKEIKGFFNKSGRVRALKLRGVPSMGYIIPVSEFDRWTNKSFEWSKHIDEEFDEFDGVKICSKYIPLNPQLDKLNRKQNRDSENRFDKLIDNQFRYHIDTSPLGKNIFKVENDDIISITCKFHGTSAIHSNVLVNRQLKWYEKFFSKFLKLEKTEYDLLVSSRSVIRNRYVNKVNSEKNYYSSDVWMENAERLIGKIEKGITLYSEIVGFDANGGYIQKGFDYKCDAKTNRLYVYRITYTTPQGKVIEFSWQQVKDYCNLYQIQTVPEFFYGKASELLGTDKRDWLDKLTSMYLEKDCEFCFNTVPDEGIVLRVDKLHEFKAFKHKSFRFKEYETKMLDSGEIDTETIETES